MSLLIPTQVAEAPRTYGSHEPAQASLHIAAPTEPWIGRRAPIVRTRISLAETPGVFAAEDGAAPGGKTVIILGQGESE
jgi:hypothetical protein